LGILSIFVGFWFRDMFIGMGSDFWSESIYVKSENILILNSEYLPVFIKLIPFFFSSFGAFLVYKYSVSWDFYFFGFSSYRKIFRFLSKK